MKKIRKLRLTEQSSLFLEIVEPATSKQPICGVDVVQRSEDAIPMGSVYAIATTLELDGYITSEREIVSTPGTIPKRFYKITDDGRLVLNTWRKLNSQHDGVHGVVGFLPDAIGSPVLA